MGQGTIMSDDKAQTTSTVIKYEHNLVADKKERIVFINYRIHKLTDDS